MSRYRHTQIGWAIIVAFLVPIAGLTIFAVSARSSIPLLIMLPLLLPLPFFGWLTVEIGHGALDVRFGPGLIRRRIALADIVSFSSVTNSWMYGWGIRFIRGGRLYNVSGTQAVELRLRDGGVVRVGTNDVEGLVTALRESLAMSAATTSEVVRPHDSTMLLPAVIIVVTGVAIVAAIILGVRPIDVSTDSSGVDVRGAGYHARIETADIVRVRLDETLPSIRYRANGFAANGRLRGHFRLSDGRSAELFVTRATPPFITIETDTDPVIFNFDDPGRTRETYAHLQKLAR